MSVEKIVMKRQWIAAGLTILGLGAQSNVAIAHSMSMREANLELRTALCAQNWSAGIRAIDHLKKITTANRQELNYFRARLVIMRDQGTRIPDWPSVDYCAGTSGDVLPSNSIVGSFTPPADQPTAPAAALSPFTSDTVTISQEQFNGIWYSEVTCQDSAPEEGVQNVTVKSQETTEFNPNQQYSTKSYFEFTTIMTDGQAVSFSGRGTESGSYSLNNNLLTTTTQNTTASYDTVLINGQPIPVELNQQMDQLFDQLYAEERAGLTEEYQLKPTPDGKLDLGEAPGCNISPGYKVVEPLF